MVHLLHRDDVDDDATAAADTDDDDDDDDETRQADMPLHPRPSTATLSM